VDKRLQEFGESMKKFAVSHEKEEKKETEGPHSAEKGKTSRMRRKVKK
jgi:hypothetical protein